MSRESTRRNSGRPLDLLRLPKPRSVLDSGVLTALGPTSGGGFSSALLAYTYETGGKRIHKELSSGGVFSKMIDVPVR